MRGTPARVIGPTLRLTAKSPWANVAFAAILAAASWPFPRIPIIGSLDESWQAALHLAIQRGVPFGSELVFSYGPLGFLTVPWPWYGPTTVPAFAVAAALQFGLCLVVVLGARRALPGWLAVVVAYLAARTFSDFEPSEALLSLTIGICAVLLLRERALSPRTVTALLVVGGVVAGAATLGKFTAGTFVGVIIAITATGLARPWWRGPVTVVLIAAATALTLWLATGQALADIPAYIANAFQIVRGYSEAMGVDRSPGAYWFVLLYLVGVALVTTIAAIHAMGGPRERILTLVLVGAVAAFALFKIAAVRWGLGYAFGALVVTLFAVSTARVRRPLFVAAFVVVLLSQLAALGRPPLNSLAPISSLRSAWSEAATVLLPWRWTKAQEANEARLRRVAAIEPEAIEKMRGATIHVDPFMTDVIAAWPELRWQPLPVFQSYSAYTTALDELNAEALRGDRAPEMILRQVRRVGSAPIDGPPTIDGRSGWFDAPAAMLETFCRYDEVAATPAWEVLARTTRHCGSPEPLSTIDAHTGDTISIPTESRADRFVIVRIDGLASVGDSIVTAAFKAPEWYITVDGRRYRLVIGTATDGLLLGVPASIARSPGFEFGPPRQTLSVERRDGRSLPLQFEFQSVALLTQ